MSTKSFDPDVRYRNLLVAMSREIVNLEDKAGLLPPCKFRFSALHTVHVLKKLMGKNRRALQFYFGTKDARVVADQEIVIDEV